MKILYRIMDVLVHPSRIAMYYKDKFYTVLIHLLVAVGLCVGTIAILAFNQNYFTRSFADDFVPIVQQQEESYDIVYENDTLTGTKQKFTYGNYILYMSNSKYKNDDAGKYVLVFDESKVTGYYNQDVVFTDNYSDFSLRYSFTLENVRAGNIDAQVAFVDMLAEAFDNFEDSYALNVFLNEIASLAMDAIIIIVIMLVYSYLINPTIKGPVRVKLIAYDIIIFFFAFSLYEIIGVSIISFIAFVMPIFYTGVTFRHIIRINRKGV
ncbi:MAG: hypothetical protein K6A63_04610 [Acholeplasmatales bacterium]|nr:hypothetical protein [Acholeplasmatales bacterium]